MEYFTGIQDKVRNNEKIKEKPNFEFQGNQGQIKRVIVMEAQKKKTKYNFYGPVLDLDLTYPIIGF